MSSLPSAAPRLLSTYLTQAARATHPLQARCRGDPLIYHEMGCMAFKSGDYVSAVSWLRQGVDLIRCSPREVRVVMQPTLLALAHAYRKMQDFAEAEVWYEECLLLTPHDAAVLAALAYTYHLAGRYDAAVETYHKALALRPDDTFAQTMLRQCLADALAGGVAALGLGSEEEEEVEPIVEALVGEEEDLGLGLMEEL